MRRTSLPACLLLAAVVAALLLLPRGAGAADPPPFVPAKPTVIPAQLPSSVGKTKLGFFGVQDWSTPTDKVFQRVGVGGVGTYRLLIPWWSVEKTKGVYDWHDIDLAFGRAAQAGIPVLPFIAGSPHFYTGDYHRPPTRKAGARKAWNKFLIAAAHRYGPNGEFWRSNPSITKPLPVHDWQIWNEPNVAAYWFEHPKPSEYVTLLRISRRALRSVDPKARIVLAGIPETTLNNSMGLRSFLKGVYKTKGAKAQFDVVALHPYAATYEGVIGGIERARQVMRANGDRRTAVWITEIGWASGGKLTKRSKPFITNRTGQAAKVRTLYREVLKRRKALNIRMVIWFSLRDRKPIKGEPNWWAINTGLFNRTGDPKGSWRAYSAISRTHQRNMPTP